MRALIIDDEPDARELLRNYLEQHIEAVTDVGEATGVADGLAQIERFEPDLVLLDLKMGDGIGFQLLDQVSQINFQVIFTTAFSEFAIRAFKYSAVDYLLKPIDPFELMEAVKRAQALRPQQEESLNNLRNIYQSRGFERLALPGMDEYVFVNVKEVVRLRADKNYTEFHMIDGKTVIVSTTLKTYESILPPELFYRIHQSHLINLHQIVRYVKRYNSVEMSDGSELEVSKRKRAEFRKMISSLTF